MEAAGEKQRQPGKSRVVVGVGGGGGLLLLGGVLVASAAMGVAFVVRAATKKKKESPQEAQQEETCNSQGRAQEMEDREGLNSLLPPLPPQASPPSPPLPQEEEDKDSSFKDEQAPIDLKPSKASESGADDSSAIKNGHGFVQKSDSVQEHEEITEKSSPSDVLQGTDDSSFGHEETRLGQNPSAVSESGADNSSVAMKGDGSVKTSNFVQEREKIVVEICPVGDGQENGGKDALPVIVRKDVVVEESKIIQVVEHASARRGGGEAAAAAVEEEEEEGAAAAENEIAVEAEEVQEEEAAAVEEEEEEADEEEEEEEAAAAENEIAVEAAEEVEEEVEAAAEEEEEKEGTATAEETEDEGEEEEATAATEKEATAAAVVVVVVEEEAEEEGTGKNLETKAMLSSLPSVGLVCSPKPMAMAAKEEVFHGSGEKLGIEEDWLPWKESTGYVLGRMVLEMKKKGFSKNAPAFLVLSTVLLTTLLAIWLHHYSNKAPESNHI